MLQMIKLRPTVVQHSEQVLQQDKVVLMLLIIKLHRDLEQVQLDREVLLLHIIKLHRIMMHMDQQIAVVRFLFVRPLLLE